jgi:hypothetical protein
LLNISLAIEAVPENVGDRRISSFGLLDIFWLLLLLFSMECGWDAILDEERERVMGGNSSKMLWLDNRLGLLEPAPFKSRSEVKRALSIDCRGDCVEYFESDSASESVTDSESGLHRLCGLHCMTLSLHWVWQL